MARPASGKRSRFQDVDTGAVPAWDQSDPVGGRKTLDESFMMAMI
jgi:hypothetical protein